MAHHGHGQDNIFNFIESRPKGERVTEAIYFKYAGDRGFVIKDHRMCFFGPSVASKISGETRRHSKRKLENVLVMIVTGDPGDSVTQQKKTRPGSRRCYCQIGASGEFDDARREAWRHHFVSQKKNATKEMRFLLRIKSRSARRCSTV